MGDFTPYQQKIIRNYYDNKDALALQRLGELTTDLYLAEGKARAKLWKKVRGTLERAGLSADRIDHVVGSDNPALVAKVVEELMAQPQGRKAKK